MGKTLVALALVLLIGARPVNDQKLIEEIRVALVDIQQAVRAQKLDIELLQEQFGHKKTENLLEMRVAEIEKVQSALSQDLHKLASYTNETSNTLSHQLKQLKTQLQKFEELKETLDSVASALDQGTQKHKVRSGETLEKIARQHSTTVDAIKKRNHLSSNTILVGQELSLP